VTLDHHKVQKELTIAAWLNEFQVRFLAHTNNNDRSAARPVSYARVFIVFLSRQRVS
jgi:hypothetical protein